MHHLVIDTDPGVDDALALLMARAHPESHIVALTIAAGNVGLTHTVANALKLLDVIELDVPVHPGCAVPLVQHADDAAFVHGRDGFGDTGMLASQRRASDEHAALALVRLARERPGELTYVMLGPLTNLALALRLEPRLPQWVKRLVIMGGAVTGRGNVARLPVEFNIGFDPEAARVVFESWPRFELVDWEATLRHGFPFARFELWLTTPDPRAAFYAAISRKTRDFMRRSRHAEQWHAADALAMAVTLEPQRVTTWADRHARVELSGELTRGSTLVDWGSRLHTQSNCLIAMEFPRERFQDLLASALGAGAS